MTSVEALQPLEEIIARQENKDELSFLSRPGRLKLINDHLGFYPQSNGEASRITALIGRNDQPDPAFWHLNEVSIHQYSLKASARDAVESIVRDFEEFAGSAVNEAYYMELLLHNLAELNPSGFTSFNTLFPTEDWRHDTTQIATFSALSRHIETDQFVETGEDNPLSKMKLINRMAGDERIQRISGTLGSIRASSLKKNALSLRSSQDSRLSFWTNQLESAEKHLFARDIASKALDELVRITR